MKTSIKRFLQILFLFTIGIACEKEITNPFDPDCPKEIWTPTNFKAVQSENKLDLTWEQDNMNISGFKIDRKVGTEDWSNVASPGKTSTTWSDTDLKGGEVHQYRLCACAGDNMSNTVTAQATPVFAASLTTAAQTDLACNSATLGGNISNTGGATITERGIVYAKSDNPTTSHTKVTMGNGEGSFKQSVTGLEEKATYYVRAYAINSAGTSYGNQISFTTPPCAVPATVTTSIPTDVSITSATLGGNVTDDGGATVTERGVVFNTSENPTFAHNKVQIGSGKGSFSKRVTGLAENTAYFVCAYAINSQDTAYGNQESFKTSPKILTVSPSSREVGPEAGTTSFTVNSNVDWIPSESSSWLTVTKTNSTTLSVSFTANTSTSSRTASIKVSDGEIEKIVSVTQAGVILTIIPASREVGSGAGNTNFSVNSNVTWSIKSISSTWLTATKDNSTTISVNFTANTSTSSRTANIKVSGGGIEKTITVIQAAGVEIFLTVTPSSREVGPEAGTTSFTVNSNADWIPSESSTWLTATKTNNTTLSVSFTANTSTNSRSASIKVSGGGIEKTVSVIQQEPTLVVNPSSIILPWQGGSSNITVNSNVNWNFTKDASWLNVSKTNNTTLSISCVANSTVNSKTASINVSGGGLVRKITVTQPGICDIDPDSRRVSWKAGSTNFSVNTGVGWSVTDNVTWLTATKTSGSNISVEYQQNESTNSRTAIITASFTGNIKETATVIQNGFFDVQPNGKSVSGSAGYTTFKVTSGVEWNASVKDTWLKVTIIDKTTLRVNYDSYYNIFVYRYANIRVYNADGEEETVSLRQSGW